MSDITVPSWRPQAHRPAGPPLRLLAIAGALLGVAALGGAVVWGVSRVGPRPVPVIEADSRPLKVRPENPGGLVVANQDQLVLEPPSVRRAAERSKGASAKLDSGPEAPALEELRQQVAPPTAISMLPPVSAPGPAPGSLPPIAGPGPAAGTTPLPPAVAAPAAAPGASALGMPAAAPGALAPPVAPAAASLPAPAAGSFKPVPNGRAQVQLGALASEEAAKAEWDRLVSRIPDLAGFQPRILRLDREGQPTLWRLRTGAFADPAAARGFCEAVRARGGNCVPTGS